MTEKLKPGPKPKYNESTKVVAFRVPESCEKDFKAKGLAYLKELQEKAVKDYKASIKQRNLA